MKRVRLDEPFNLDRDLVPLTAQRGQLLASLTFLTEREAKAAKRDATAQPGLGKVRKTTRRRDREGHSNYKAKWPLKVLPGAPDGAELDSPLQI